MTHVRETWHRREGLALLTDYYELTMLAGYWKANRAQEQAAFEYFFRSLPPHAGFAVAAGLQPFLDYLENLRFTADDLAYLRSLNAFEESFLNFLADFRPQCTIRAVPEGTLVFPHEPVVQVQGTLMEAQFLETALLNFMNYQTLIATKAARVCQAAEGQPVLEFGLRRAHGPDGGLSGSRAAYIGGCHSTSNVLAGKVYDLPVAGTHAHSWVMSFQSELEAFREFANQYPDKCVLLVDTYDTIESGVPNAITVYKEMRDRGCTVRPAIRLDSGDLAKLSKQAHKLMTDAGFDNPLIVASNDLDEDLIADLKRQGAKINAWGVGTKLITAFDCPALNGVYKLVAVQLNGQWHSRIKLSSNLEKATDPGRKEIVRCYAAGGEPLGDVLCEAGEELGSNGRLIGRHRLQPHLEARIKNVARTEILFETVFENGKRTMPPPSIHAIRERAQQQMAAMPDEYKRLRNPQFYNVILSPAIGAVKENLLLHPDLL
jgi:nicotinate phosphoribosyltransferase